MPFERPALSKDYDTKDSSGLVLESAVTTIFNAYVEFYEALHKHAQALNVRRLCAFNRAKAQKNISEIDRRTPTKARSNKCSSSPTVSRSMAQALTDHQCMLTRDKDLPNVVALTTAIEMMTIPETSTMPLLPSSRYTRGSRAQVKGPTTSSARSICRMSRSRQSSRNLEKLSSNTRRKRWALTASSPVAASSRRRSRSSRRSREEISGTDWRPPEERQIDEQAYF
ncbi:hypothetical protein IWX47DRAFT_307027 [Phyllosticta citricarpa]